MPRQTLAQCINATLSDALAARPELLVFGEDVGRKGGVYGLTRGLQQRFGAPRVFDTLLDEQSILGLALGFGVSGLLPVPEIQYLAYLHNAEDQLRGEAASLRRSGSVAARNSASSRIWNTDTTGGRNSSANLRAGGCLPRHDTFTLGSRYWRRSRR